MAPGERRRRSVIAKLVELAIALSVLLLPTSALALTRASVVENASALAARNAKTRVRGFELGPAKIASGFELSSARNASGKSARGRGEGVRVHHSNRQWSPELGAFLSRVEFGYVTTEGTLWSWPNQNPIAIRDPFGTGESRADTVFNWLSGGNFGFGFAVYARGMEQRRQGLLNLSATGGDSLKDVECGTARMAAGLDALTTEAAIAIGGAGAASSGLKALVTRSLERPFLLAWSPCRDGVVLDSSLAIG